jgi:aspartate racemase
MPKPLHIGLIGGIGVAATVVYYQRLSAAVRARGGRLDLTIVQAEVDDLVRNVNSGRREEQAAIYAPLIDRLKAAGCDCAAITSIGGHFCFAETLQRASLPMISAVAPLDDFFAGEALGTVGLLGTRVVMQSRIYGLLQRTRPLVLDDRIPELGQAYQDLAIAGRCDPAQRALFHEAGAALMARGADAVVLAGTDLNLAFDPAEDPGYRVIDALDVHVALLADLACGTRDLDAVAAR